VGTALVFTWYSALAIAFSSWLVPLTEVSSRLRPPWAIALVAILLVAVWALANRIPPDFETALPRRRKTRRPGRSGR
jgi:hypothetical protein